MTSRQRGFTFVEILVALVIVSVGTLAVASQIGSAARTARFTQQKTLANWIALNKVTELRLIEGVPEAGRDNDEIEYAGRIWYWESEIKKPPGDVDNFMRIEVSVGLADDPEYVLAQATGFVGRGPIARNARPWTVRLPASGGGGGNGNGSGPRSGRGNSSSSGGNSGNLGSGGIVTPGNVDDRARPSDRGQR